MKAASLNHIYRLVWSRLQQAWVAVAETARAQGKSSLSGTIVAPASISTAARHIGSITCSAKRGLLVASALCAVMTPFTSYADSNVVAGVVAGDLTIKDLSSTQTQYTHTANVNIVDFYKFGVEKGHQLDVVMPDAGRALYRVIGDSRSEIMGTLNSNGSLFLINQNGVLFGNGSEVNVGNIVASSLNITNDNFLKGNYSFAAGAMVGNVENYGVIKAKNEGYIVLLGKTVDNSGTLVASNGSVVLGSAQQATLDFFGNGLVKTKLSGGALEATIKNSGPIYADGGFVQMATNARASAINISGIVEANQLVERNGVIRLEGGDNAKVQVSGQLIAKGLNTTGGTIEVTGEQVALMNGALLDASGDKGGGKVLVGGDYQGKNDSVYNARTTYVASGATIKADAIEEGNGGKVVVWADDLTRYYGDISAQGGVSKGNGGFVEVSGKQYLAMLGDVNVGALNGIGGTVLFDPENIELTDRAETPITDKPNGTPDIAFLDNPGANIQINVSRVKGFSELYLQANNDITVSSPLLMSQSTGSVNMVANNNINVNADIKSGVLGSITLKADADNSGAGDINIKANITGGGQGVTLSAVNITQTAGNIGTNQKYAGNVTLTANGGDIDLGNAEINTTPQLASGSSGNVQISARSLTMSGSIITKGAAASSLIDKGGQGGDVSIKTTQNMTVGDITTSSGTPGAGTMINGKFVAASSTRSGNIDLASGTGDINTGNINSGNTLNNIGGNLKIAAAGAVTTKDITTSAGDARTNTSGESAGNVNITAGTNLSVGNISAKGSDGSGTNKSGGQAGTVNLTASNGNIDVGAINNTAGAKTGTGFAGISAKVLVNAGQNLTVKGDIVNNDTSTNAVQLVAGGVFDNSQNINIKTNGNWTVYSKDPTNDIKGSNLLAAYDYKQYGTAFGDKLLGTGNGFVHQVSPTVTATLTGTSTKVVDGTTAVTDLSGLNVNVTGILDKDVVILSPAPSPITSASFDTAAVGTGKAISTGAYTIISARTNENKPIFNAYTTVVNNSTATGSITAVPTTPTTPTTTTLNISPRDNAGLGGLVGTNPALNTMTIVSLNPAAGDDEDPDAVACPVNEDHLGSTPILSSGVKLPDGVNSNCI